MSRPLSASRQASGVLNAAVSLPVTLSYGGSDATAGSVAAWEAERGEILRVVQSSLRDDVFCDITFVCKVRCGLGPRSRRIAIISQSGAPGRGNLGVLWK